MFMVVDLDDPSAIVELTVAASTIAGAYPTFTAVVSGDDFPSVVGPALEGAHALLNG